MKKCFSILVALILFLFAPSVFAVDRYTVYLGTSDSGNTTSNNSTSGVSELIVEGFGIQRSLSRSVIPIDSGGLWYVQVADAEVSQAALGKGDYSSGSTFEFGFKVFLVDSTQSNAEKVPVILNRAINSATTAEQVAFTTPHSRYMSFYFKPSGVTPFDRFKAYVIGPYPLGSGPTPDALTTGTTTWTLTTTGVSNFQTMGESIPDGTNNVVVSFEDAARVAFDTQADPTTSSGIYCDECNAITLSRQAFEAGDGFRAISETNSPRDAYIIFQRVWD